MRNELNIYELEVAAKQSHQKYIADDGLTNTSNRLIYLSNKIEIIKIER